MIRITKIKLESSPRNIKISSNRSFGIVFFIVVTPTGLIMRAFKKDLLNLKKKDTKSYWINKLHEN